MEILYWGQNHELFFKHPWVLTWDSTVLAWTLCVYLSYFWCVVVKPGVRRSDDQDPTRYNQLWQTTVKLHWVRKTANEIPSKYTAKPTHVR